MICLRYSFGLVITWQFSHRGQASIDWFKGKNTGKSHISWENLWFPVFFPVNQPIESPLRLRTCNSLTCSSSRDLWVAWSVASREASCSSSSGLQETRKKKTVERDLTFRNLQYVYTYVCIYIYIYLFMYLYVSMYL